MAASQDRRSLRSELLTTYVALVVFFAILKYSAASWGGAGEFLSSLSWVQIAVGPAIAALCASGSHRLADRIAGRKLRRPAAD